ncbi:hypothetical protein QYE76_065936 [Lolium multiflorum]|uniref:Uncharacterized protein n=1 Tax=Lolium multiflorum TaxID=4521 RepID=A0AAD8SB20_LOLMU|nr:hypothetical protein QYE76_065936 [Lolium multiflorum]
MAVRRHSLATAAPSHGQARRSPRGELQRRHSEAHGLGIRSIAARTRRSTPRRRAETMGMRRGSDETQIGAVDLKRHCLNRLEEDYDNNEGAEIIGYDEPDLSGGVEGSTADARKQLFEELLWEHRDLAEAHNHCQAVPEATLETLKAQIATLQGEKEQLIRQHQEALSAQKTSYKELKEQAMQARLQHDQHLKDAKAAAEARLAEVVEDSTNSNTVLMTELEEERKARKAAEHHIEVMTTDHKEYDRLVMQIDALALQHFPDSQAHAVKKVMEDRVAREFPNMDAHWDGYDYLVALSARVQHMRSVDRTLVDLPDAAIQIFKVLWPEEAMPANITLTAN